MNTVSNLKLYFFPAILLLLQVAQVTGQGKQPSTYVIRGTLENLNGQYIYFSCKGAGAERVWDSTRVKGNSFAFSGTLTEPANGFITTLPFNRVKNLEDKNITGRLFIGPFVMTISLQRDNFKGARLNGSMYQDEYDKLEQLKMPWYKEIKILDKLYDSLVIIYTDSTKSSTHDKPLLEATMDSVNRVLAAWWENCATTDKEFFASHPNSYITAYLLKDYFSTLSLKELQYYYHRMLPATQQWEYGIRLKKAIADLQQGSAGGKAANFTATDIRGDSIVLSQFRGKYVLLDFWASWCKPCRAGNPELIRLYNKYHHKGIEFIGIADDNGSEDKWQQAIAKDSIHIWRHILDKKIGDKYAVHSIPVQILIDPDGMIIERFGPGGEPNENISKSLEKLFGKNL